MSKYYRLVICLDVEADSLESAYEKVYRTMGGVDCREFQWESTDEAYDEDGNQVEEEEMQRVRHTVFARLNSEAV